MSFWDSKLRALLGVLLLACFFVASIVGVRVYVATHPERQADEGFDFNSMLMRVEQVQFPAVDGTRLAGWLIEGDATRPPVLLCHDLGSSKASQVSLGIELQRRGFTVLMLDFRGHGQSEGRSSTLGLEEKRDILGALDFLAERYEREGGRVGIYGVGMGAHAAVLAAVDRPSLRVLVLDALYPDVSDPLARRVFGGWEPGIRSLAFVSNGLFALMYRTRIGEHRAADALPGLLGRDVLLLAPAGDPELTAEIQRMVESIPDQPEVDGNMVVLPATQGGALYGEDLDRHREQVARFLDHRLGGGALPAAHAR
jgi:pimeloyl-ACP methyl ester carboxylesterase